MSIVEKEYNRITLYPMIKVFIEKGIIHKITLSGNEAIYVICKEECDTVVYHQQHIHFNLIDVE